MFTTSTSATGRSTVGYWGIECKSGKVVFVKDIWRTNIPEVETEGTVLKRLLEAGVRNIPGLVCHGDVVHGGKTIILLVSVQSKVSPHEMKVPCKPRKLTSLQKSTG